DWLRRHGIPRALGVLIHYLVLLGLIALFLAFVVPQLVHEIQSALTTSGSSPPKHTGVKQQILDGLQRRLGHLPSVGKLVHPALRSEEHTSELQSRGHLVCRLLLEKKKKIWILLENVI